MSARIYAETLHEGYAQQFVVDRVLFENKTDHQHLIIFDNPMFGRVMALDGIIQTTEKDEFIYHEMLTHVPLLSHPHPEHILVIGGGDGGILREVLRHPGVKKVTLVEIDQAVVDMCREYFPNHSQGAFDDARTEIIIADGVDFVKTTGQRFDVIISDSTDPIGPGEVLFTENFYAMCERCLTDSGILVTQNGVPYFQLDEVKNTWRGLTPLFPHVAFYGAAIPTYVGGMMALGFASKDKHFQCRDLEILAARVDAAKLKTRYYTPSVHHASFALPVYIQDVLI